MKQTAFSKHPLLVKIQPRSERCQVIQEEREGARKEEVQQSKYLRMKASQRVGETGPNMSDSSDILNITLLTISPKYIPDIIFSKP